MRNCVFTKTKSKDLHSPGEGKRTGEREESFQTNRKCIPGTCKYFVRFIYFVDINFLKVRVIVRTYMITKGLCCLKNQLKTA